MRISKNLDIKCGCGKVVKNRYSHGHSGGKKRYERITIRCEFCRNEFEKIVSSKRKFCSVSCSIRWRLTVKPVWNKGKSKYPEYNYLPYFCECGCGEICNHGKRYISGHNSRVSNGFKDKHHSIATKSKWDRKVQYNRMSFEKKAETYKKAMETAGRKPNNEEKFLDTLIQSAIPKEYKFTGDGQIWINGKNPDWFNTNGKKKLIEYFGCWHHACKFCYPNRRNSDKIERDDRSRIEHYKKYGFKTLVIWWHELEDPCKVAEKIKEFTIGT